MDKKTRNFTARITLSPVCPRYLEDNAFDIFYNSDEKNIIDTFLYEISHFIFFEKLKEVYPTINPEEFEHPHLIWKISEIMPGIILQDEKIQKIFKNENLSVYDNIKKIKIINKNIKNKKSTDFQIDSFFLLLILLFVLEVHMVINRITDL